MCVCVCVCVCVGVGVCVCGGACVCGRLLLSQKKSTFSLIITFKVPLSIIMLKQHSAIAFASYGTLPSSLTSSRFLHETP